MPISFTVVMYGSYRIDPGFFERHIRHESGFIENATFLWFFLAFLLGAAIVRRRPLLPYRFLRIYFVVFTLGCVFTAAEEISWGQTWFRWATPDTIAALNQQEETNLHNIFEPALNRIPRTLLGLFALAAGVIWVVFNCLTGARYDDRSDWRYWVYPGFQAMPAALLVVVSRWPYYLERWMDLEYLFIPDYGKYTEIYEFQLGVFILLYAAAVLRRLGRARGVSGSAAGAWTSSRGEAP